MLPTERIDAAHLEPLQRRAAAALITRGLVAGDRVAVIATSSRAMVATVMGALRAGIIPIVLNPQLLVSEQDALVADGDPSVILRDADVEALVASDPEAELAPVPLARPMHYTSGTTGVPKGVWSGVLSEADASALIAEERELWAFDSGDVHLACSPMHHSAPLRFAMGTLLAGGSVIVMPRFDPATIGQAIVEHAPTSTFCVPTHLQRLFATDLPSTSSFRLVAHAGAPCPESLKLQAFEAFPTDTVWEFYGSTEGQFTACPPWRWLERPGTVGKARPNRTITVDDDRTIWCAVPPYARFEYWRAPEKTSTAWRGDAFTVGDLGRIDDDGFVFLDGRRDDLIISGGMNVYPVEVEQSIERMDGVLAAAVFGVADERWGQRVCAAVVGEVTAEAVAEHCRAHLAGYKRPKDVFLVDELPMTSTGKLMRAALAEAVTRSR